VSVDSSSCNFALSPCGLLLFEDSTTTSSATTRKTTLNRSPPSARRKLDGGMTRLFADKQHRSPLLPHKKSREFSEDTEDCLSVGSFQISALAIIYDKSLRLPSVGGSTSSGKIVNLASNDVERFLMACIMISYLFWGPVQAIAVLIVGLKIIWPAFIAGYAFLLVIVAGGVLTPRKVFTTMSLINVVQFTLTKYFSLAIIQYYFGPQLC